jgi:hypothetical protein
VGTVILSRPKTQFHEDGQGGTKGGFFDVAQGYSRREMRQRSNAPVHLLVTLQRC